VVFHQISFVVFRQSGGIIVECSPGFQRNPCVFLIFLIHVCLLKYNPNTGVYQVNGFNRRPRNIDESKTKHISLHSHVLYKF